jgi:hypothetical protein
MSCGWQCWETPFKWENHDGFSIAMFGYQRVLLYHCSYHFYLVILNASYDHCDEHEWWLLFLLSYYYYYSLLVSCIMINYND